MKVISISILLILFAATACLEPPRDNPYDPGNPDKGYLAGTAYDHNVQPLADVLMTLNIHDEVKYSTRTNAHGDYEFAEVDPGIYTLVAEATGYSALTFDNIEIKSYTENDTFDIYFQVLCFDKAFVLE